MYVKSAVGAAILATALNIVPAGASERTAQQQNDAAGLFAPVYDETLPPVGYVNFCKSFANECAGYNAAERLASDRLAMSPERWNTLYQVNTYANGKVKPVSDQELYGKAEHWTYPTTAGDCEDFVLLKKRALEKLGVAAKQLQITVVLDERGEGHAVLTVATDEGDFILDNRRNDILLWSDTNYSFLKRQSQESPRKWVALMQRPGSKGDVTSAKMQ
jgi:predicted transglutaminase-like cysteine proteinase